MPDPKSGFSRPAILRSILVVTILVTAVALAGYAALTDSVTVDEPSHLVAGYAALELGDFRLSPDHPPLARLLLALPLLGGGVAFEASSPEAAAAWHRGDFFRLGGDFFETWNDGQSLARRSRVVAIALFAGLLLTTWQVAHRLFGSAGGLLALVLVAFDPNLLAHGHLATIDVPFTLVALLCLLALGRWLAEPRPARLGLAAVAFAAAALVKFSFVALIPALVVMVVVARRHQGGAAVVRAMALMAAAFAGVTLIAIWAAYGCRFAAASGEDAATATMQVPGDAGQALPTTAAGAWETVLHDPATGRDRGGIAVPLLRFARSVPLLPEAYLFGIAYVAKMGSVRASYLNGRYSRSGFRDYFLWAFFLKTPLPSLLLFGLGLALALRRWWQGVALLSPLAAGFVAFAVCYLAALASSTLNLGVRHLLPLTPLLAIAAAGILAPGTGAKARALVAALLSWLVIGTLVAAPHWIGYFNESIGGWRSGHHYLADSNLDWGQDLLRLGDRLRIEDRPGREPGPTPVWLLLSGDPPLPRSLAAQHPRWLFGQASHAPSTEKLAGGLFVISATELLGVYRPLARVETWRDPRWIARYEELAAEQHRGSAVGAPGQLDDFEILRRLRLVARLAQRPPGERIGTSLFLFRLSDQQVAEATAP